MTNDELVKHLDINHNHEAGLIPIATQAKIRQAAARIEALEAQLSAADDHAKYLEDMLNKVIAWDGKPVTHVIVPVEPTEDMMEAGIVAINRDVVNGFASERDHAASAYAAMIKATQEQPK